MSFRDRSIGFPLSILAVALLIAIVIGISKPEPQTQALPEPRVPAVAAQVVTPRAESVVVTGRGTVAPKMEIDLVAQVGGQIVSVDENFAQGGRFARGELLLQIDPRDYEADVVRAASGIAASRQALAQERGQARQARREWRDLGNDEANALFLREPQIAAAEAAVQAAIADHQQAKLNVERTRLKVPFAGRVRAIHVNLGQYVTPGTAVARVFSADILEIKVPLTERQLALLPQRAENETSSLPATITTTVHGQRQSWRGAVVRMDAALDTESRVRYAIVEVNLKDAVNAQLPALEAGAFVEVAITGRHYADVVSLPVRALYQRDQLLLLDGQNRLYIRQAELLAVDEETVMLRGVPADATVMIGRPGYIVEGMLVTPLLKNVEKGAETISIEPATRRTKPEDELTQARE